MTFMSVLILLSVLLLGIYIYRNYDTDDLVQNLTGGQAETGTVVSSSFPVSLTGAVPQQLEATGNSLVLRTTDEVIFFDTNGRNQHSFTHRFTNPILKTGGGRLLTYDRGGYGYRTDSSSGLHYTGRTESTILTGAISSRGSYALAVAETRYAGSVIVNDRGNEEILRWYSVTDQIIDLAFSDNGNELAIACVGFEDNTLVGKVYVVNVSKSTSEEKAVFTFADTMPIAVDYKTGGSIHLLCDNYVGIIDSDLAEQQQIEFSNKIYSYGFTDDATILLNTDMSAVSYTLTSINRTGKRNDVQVKGGGNDMVIDDNGTIYLLEKNSILTFDDSLELKKEIPTDSSVFAMAAIGSKLYLLSDAKLGGWEDLSPQ